VGWAPVTKEDDFHRDPNQAEQELLMSKDIMKMPVEVIERFKALKVLYDRCGDADEEEEKEYRAIERKYEQLYAGIYLERAKIVKGDSGVDAELLEQYDHRMTNLMDDKYASVEQTPCDVKSIQNGKGVSDFWLRVLTLNKSTARAITEKDRPILNYLQDISLKLHDEDMGFTLTFIWEPNHYFDQTVTTKEWHMSRPNTVEKCVGTVIEWKAGCDPSKIKKNKKKNKKKVVVYESIPSFFDIFQTIDMTNKDEGDAEDEEGDEQAEKMDDDMELGNEIKDNIIPLALEIYLGVVELGDSEPEDGDDDDDDDDDDMPKMPKGMKLPKNFKPGKKGAPNPEDCKQQ